nr:alpha-2-macroglobulin [Azomonas macrocytogenes]
MRDKWMWFGMALTMALLTGCEQPQTDPASSAAPATVAAPVEPARPPLDRAALAKRYAGRELNVVDVSEIQVDGASTLSVSVSVPLDPEQDFAARLHLVDARDGKVDGAWELSDNLLELRLRYLQPKRKLVLTVDPGLRALTGSTLPREHIAQLETRDLQPSVGFASRGSLLPTRLAEGLPVLALNVGKVDVDFFRIKTASLPAFLTRWQRRGMLGSWESQEILPMAELVYSGRFDLAARPNIQETLLLPLSGLEPLKQPGVYVAVMRQAGTYDYQQPATLFTLSDIGLSAHRSREQIDVFTQALAGGQAQAGVTLTLLDAEGHSLAEGQSDNRGHARLPNSPKASLLLARQGGQTSLLRLDGAALDLAEFDIGGAIAQPLQFFIFGPRDLYRPGETVLLNALLRDADGRALKAQPVSVEVRRPDNQTSRSFVWQPDADGLYQYRLPLGSEAPTGRWQLLMNLGGGKPPLYEFSVEDFLPERLALELKGSAEPLVPADPLSVAVNGRYLYGAPASGNLVSGQLYVRPLREAVAALPGYQFGSVTEADLKQSITLDDLTLDERGHGQIELESRWRDARSPLQLTVQASLQESGGRPVTRRLEQPVWPAQRLPGIRALFDGEQIDADSQAEFELLIADAQGHRLAADAVKVRLIRERRDYYWQFSEGDGWSSQYNEKFLTLAEETLNLAQDGSAKLGFPVEWGPYRVEVEDPQTGLVSSLRFWAGYRWQDNTEGGAVRPDQVKLALDKPAYAEGETARITVTPPAAGNGYLLLESAAGPLWWQPIEVPVQGKTFELPIDKTWARHDLYVSALVVRPGERQAQITPKRAVGLLHLPLAREQRKLALTLAAPTQMRPSQPLKVRVKARNADGSLPQQVHVLVSAVDTGILNITDYRTPDPFQGFFGRKAYAADQFDVYGQLIEAGQGRLASLTFGGDDAELSKGGKPPLTKVTLVAQQSQPLSLDANGEGEVALQIPDFNGELRLMAQAWTDERYGSAEAKTVVAAPLVAELAAPRFLAGGDETTLALDLTNLTEQLQTLTAQLAVTGQLALPNGSGQSVTLKAGERQTLRIPVRALGGYGQGQINLRVSGVQLPGETLPDLERQWTLGVRPAWPARREHVRAVLPPGADWTLAPSVLATFDPASREAFVNLSSRPPLNLAEHIQALEAYPYGCLEQITSGLYPALYADAATLARLGLKGESDSVRQQKIETGIERLLGMQRYNGGFGLWSADSPEEFWLTAYVTDFLLRARERGFSVPETALKKASERLLRYMQEPNLIETGYSQNDKHDRFAVQAYAGYVLARSQQAPLGALRTLFERRADAASGLPLVHLAIALQRMGDAPRAREALQAGLQQTRTTNQWLHDYGSPLRDQALIYALLQEHDLDAGARETRLFGLADLLAARRWLSTQERNALFLAGRRLLDMAEPAWQAELVQGAQTRPLAGERSLNLTLDSAALGSSLTIRNLDVTPLYQQVTVAGYPDRPLPVSSDNLKIHREFLGTNGTPLALDEVRSGQLIVVHLAVTAKERIPDALVVDLLPAGLELENQNLAQSSASLKDASPGFAGWLREMQDGRIKHQEFRDDRYVAAVDLNGYGTTHLLYLARAVTPGHYVVPQPQVESMYRPDLQAVGEPGGALTVKER